MRNAKIWTKTTGNAKDFIEGNEDFENKNSIVVYNPEWSKGVIGIVT